MVLVPVNWLKYMRAHTYTHSHTHTFVVNKNCLYLQLTLNVFINKLLPMTLSRPIIIQLWLDKLRLYMGTKQSICFIFLFSYHSIWSKFSKIQCTKWIRKIKPTSTYHFALNELNFHAKTVSNRLHCIYF